MDLSIIGTGYVGVVTGAGLADEGHNVICYDIVKQKIENIERGISPIYEKGLDDLIKNNIGQRLQTSKKLSKAIESSDITFICVGTPSREDGSIDLQYVKDSASEIGSELKKKKQDYHLVVVKSTVVPGTTENIVIPELERTSGKKSGRDFGVIMSPEFLREGRAVEDFLNPDRIIIGANDQKANDRLLSLYEDFDCPILETDIKTAEMIKYASNTFLAAKISCINELGNICKEMDIDVYSVAEGIGLDHRISPHHLKAGLGFGGSCLPKDLKALIHKAREVGYEPDILKSVLKVNEEQARKMLRLAKKKVPDMKNQKIAVLGASFKAETDDIRESPVHTIVEGLLDEQVKVSVYDPEASENLFEVYSDKIDYTKTAEDALKDAVLALIVTDWREFEYLDYSQMDQKVIIDGRRIVKNKDEVDYEGLCW